MKKRNLWKSIIATGFVITMVFLNNLASASDLDQLVVAKIGVKIRSGDNSYWAKSRDSLSEKEAFRIFVEPQNNLTTYIVHTDGVIANLLSKSSEKNLILPTVKGVFKVDGASPKETITIICTPVYLPELASIEEGSLDHGEWVATLNKLQKKSSIKLSEKYDNPFSIGGNTRGAIVPDESKLKTYSGNGLLIKTYEFKVKK